MPTEKSLEESMASVEEALAELQRRLPIAPSAPNWLDKMIGSFENEPAFDEVIAYGRAFREADRPTEEDGS